MEHALPRRRREAPSRESLRQRALQAKQFLRVHRHTRPHEVGLLGLVIRSLGMGLLFAVAILVADQATGAVRTLGDRIGTELSRLLPVPVVERERPSREPAAPNSAPVLDPLDRITKVARYPMSGRVPAFALGGVPPRIEISVNGAVAASVPIDPQSGHFSATVQLANGANTIVVTAIRGEERASALPRTVTLDSTPPTLTILGPADGASLEGPSVRVDGKTEAGASVTVNGHAASVSADGGFADSFQGAEGSLSIEVVARDQAGNETKRTLRVTVKQGASVSLTVGVSLDKTKVKPAASITADVFVSQAGRTLPDVSVSLYVGLARISSGRTDATGRFKATFTAPSTEGFVQVIAIVSGNGASGQAAATLEVAK